MQWTYNPTNAGFVATGAHLFSSDNFRQFTYKIRDSFMGQICRFALLFVVVVNAF